MPKWVLRKLNKNLFLLTYGTEKKVKRTYSVQSLKKKVINVFKYFMTNSLHRPNLQ